MELYERIAEYRKKGLDMVLITVTEKEAMGPADVGKKMLVVENGEAFGTIGGGAIEYFAREKAKEVMISRESFTEKYVLNDKKVEIYSDEVLLKMACGGRVTLFYEFLGPKQYLYIFGGGHCGAALAKIAKPLGFYITIIDSRKEVIDALDDSADVKIIEGFGDYIDKYGLKDNRYVVVATPSHIHDFEVLDKIFSKNIKPAYFGMLCSKKKISDYMASLHSKYGEDLDLSNFYSPIGLDLGGDSPEEVAISVASELLANYYHKMDLNSHMRNKLDVHYWEKK